MTKTSFNRVIISGCLLAMNITASFAQEEATAAVIPEKSTFTLDINSLLVIMILTLMIPMYFIGKTFIGASKILVQKQLKNSNKKAHMVIMLLLYTTMMNAQTSKYAIVNNLPFWFLVSVILLQLIVMIFMSIQTLTIQKLTSQEEDSIPEKEVKNAHEPWYQRMWTKANNFVPIEDEAKLDTGHSYDGIRELDNRAPAWFTFSFLSTIAFGILYLYVYHGSKSAPLQIEEYEIAELEAKKEAAAYLSTQANKIDENSVVMMGANDIANGKLLFTEKCAACHQAHGGSMAGGVGPNLTDDYWIHDGSIKGIFKTIKYGWPEKGMISWKDQLSPSQMSQVASYVKSLKGTNPAGAKEPQGELYTEAATTKVDSITTN
jgi:cytochrome c oxidase cbb3-type subunit III